jgi:hypothetical protein
MRRRRQAARPWLPPVRTLQSEGVNFAIFRADINHSIGHGPRGIHTVAGRVAPQLCAGAGIQRVHVVVPADIKTSLATAGEEIPPPLAKLHSLTPVVAFSAYVLPLYEPT